MMEADATSSEASKLRQALVDRLKNMGLIRTPRIEEAFCAVPRHVFVPNTERETAYSDAYVVTRWQNGQAISSCSQPSVTAVMLEMLDLQPGQRVLEIGAGTGYAAALMASIVGEIGQVVTIDIDEDIVHDAGEHLKEAGIKNVQAVCRDGRLGWEEAAPYDRVILTVSASDIAPAWREQLRPDGRLLLPFQLTSFQSEIAIPPDQCLLALGRTPTHLESIEIRPGYFMTLRGAFALAPTDPILLGPEPGLTCIATGKIDANTAFETLTGAHQDEETDVHISVHELGGLRLWLALREPRFCELYVKGNVTGGSAVPPFIRRSDSFTATIGLYEQSTWCLLKLDVDVVLDVDQKRPHRLVIRRFGSDQMLAESLKEQATTWGKAGRPFIWSAQGTMEGLQIRAYPLETEYRPQAHEVLLTRRSSQFVFTPQVHDFRIRNRNHA